MLPAHYQDGDCCAWRWRRRLGWHLFRRLPVGGRWRRRGGRRRSRPGLVRRAGARQSLAHACRVLRRRTAARLHALRAADGADPVRTDRQRGPEHHGRARVCALLELRARHGGHLCGRGGCLRGGRQPGAGGLPAVVGVDAVRGGVRRARALHVRNLHVADAGRDPDPPRRLEQPPVRRHLRRRGPHGGTLGADRHHLRRSRAGRSPDRHQSDGADRPWRRGALHHGDRHGNAAADRGRLGGQAPAESRAVDGFREASVRRHDARGCGVDAGTRSPRAC